MGISGCLIFVCLPHPVTLSFLLIATASACGTVFGFMRLFPLSRTLLIACIISILPVCLLRMLFLPTFLLLPGISLMFLVVSYRCEGTAIPLNNGEMLCVKPASLRPPDISLPRLTALCSPTEPRSSFAAAFLLSQLRPSPRILKSFRACIMSTAYTLPCTNAWLVASGMATDFQGRASTCPHFDAE